MVALVGAQGGVDGVGEAPAQQSDGFGAGFAAGGEFVEVDRSRSDASGWGDRDHVQRAVQGAVAASVEPDFARGVARPGRNGAVPVDRA